MATITAKTTLLTASTLLVLSVPHAANSAQGPKLKEGTVIYKVAANTSSDKLKQLNALLNSQGLISATTTNGSQLTTAIFKSRGREKAIATILQKSGYVEFAQPDFIVEPSLQPNDPSFSNQWHHNNINSQQAWDITTGSNVLVAVCDSGFDANHPDLAANLRTDLAFNAQDGSNYIFDADGHGTGTAGSLGAVGNNATGVAGVNWNVDIIPVRVAISDTNSSAYISTMAKCIEYAADNGARVVNLSYGGIQYAAIDSAAQYLRSKGGLLFMSAGNDGQEFASYPDYVSFIGVGATDQNDNRASFSSFGDYVDLTAPGVSIRTTYPDNRYVNYSGTSFSSPIAAGVAALMVSANPNITVDEIEAGLFSTAVDIGAAGDDNVFGHGLVDAAAAVAYAQNIGSSSAPVAQINASAVSVPYNTQITFDGSGSFDSDGTIAGYSWNLGDGTSSNQAVVNHVFAQSGAYQVTLTVSDNDGLTNSTSLNIQVTTELPTPVIGLVSNQVGVNDVITFDGSASSDNDGEIVSFVWDFGDNNSASGAQVTHSYATAGVYSATLTVTDNAGAVNAQTVEITVTDPLALNAPQNLSAQTNGLDVALTWQDTNSSETAVVVERGTKFRGKVRFETIATLPENSTSYTDTVPNEGEYHYRVTAANSVNSATSTSIKVTASTGSQPAPSGPFAPTNLAVNVSGSTANLQWTDNASNELGFYIERGVKRKGKVNFSRIAIVTKDTTQFADAINGLASGNYQYRVSAYNDEGESAYSNTAEIRLK